ncbi:MAG TPA: PQQ-binding-like beta-propeller repeat protein, partial [Planctomycetaceae bacterium]
RIYIASGLHPEFGELSRGRLICLDPTRQGDISSELAVDAAGHVIPHRRIQAVDVARGEKVIPNPNSGQIWEFTLDNDGNEHTDLMHGTMSNVAVHKGLAIALDHWGAVHCLDAKTGKLHWSYDALAPIYGSPLIVDDKVFVVDHEGDVMVFNLSHDPQIAMRRRDGAFEPFSQMAMGNAVDCSPIFANGVLYLAGQNELFAIAADR